MHELARKLAGAAIALAASIGFAGAAGAASGAELYERRCAACHVPAPRTEPPVGPSLAGIVGTRPRTQASTVHTRVLLHTPVVWDRQSLRSFLSEPLGDPGTAMPVDVENAAELESLLDYLESLR